MTTPAPATTTDLRSTADGHLRALVGRGDAALYDDQWAAIEALVVQRRRALVVQRTGWGKSAVYFVATALLRAQGSGPTVIVSPLLALMRNQIEAAERAGIRAVTINSTNIEQWREIEAEIAAGRVDVLLVSPERLNNPGFRDDVLPSLTDTAGLLVVDEAHCISDWGHDFRPDYRRIRQMLADLPTGIPVLATTATANARVTTDVAEQLETGEGDVLVQRGSLDRESLRLGVVRLGRPQERLGWLADHLADFEGSGIVYCLTVAATQEVAEYLSSRGHDVAAYSGQTDPAERLALESALAEGGVKALVATSALGMGFDARLGFVVNLGAPQSPVAYYQQVGRAGRGTDRADVVLLPAPEDRDIWRYFAALSFPPEQHVQRALSVLAEEGRPTSTATLETYVDLGRSRLEMMLKVLDVDGAVRRERGGWVATGQEWVYDQERYDRVARARQHEQDAMLEYLDTDRCRMDYLREQLDDPGLHEGDAGCGRCDNCGGLGLDGEVSAESTQGAEQSLQRPGVTVQPRKLWPTAMANLGLDLRGKIPPEEAASPGRAVARLTDLGHGQHLRTLFAPGAEPVAELPRSLVGAVIEVLDDWRPGVDAIVAFESRSHSALVDDLTDGLSRYLNVPVVGRLKIRDDDVDPGQGQANSAQRVAAASRRYDLRADDVAGRSVLLVDDQVVTGWSLTLAARWIRQAGADSVHPLVLATR